MKNQGPPELESAPESADYRELLRDLTAALTPLQMLHQQAIEALAPSVREILDNGSRDTRLIEHTLDRLLARTCIPQGLATFKSVCRHYWPINPQATTSYISAYREMWDSEPHNRREAGLE